MIETISDAESISVFMSLIRNNNEYAFAGLAFFISLINYYSFSSHNN